MKKMNRREFLTLTGAALAMMALAACGSTPSTPAVPTTGEEAKVLEAINKYRAAAGYNVSGRPIGMSMNSSGSMMPVCVYTENVDLLVKNLSMLDEADQTNLKSASLIAIQLFEYGGVKYWVAVAANGKK